MWAACVSWLQVPCTGFVCNYCNNGTTIWDPSDPKQCPDGSHCTRSVTFSSYMVYSKSPTGPWSTPQKLPAPFQGDTNLAPLIRADGSLVGLGRPPYIWRSPDWRNASAYTIEQAAGPLAGEDPMIYIDAANPNTIHAVLHGGGWDSPNGHHYWSNDDAKTWMGHNDEVWAYTNSLSYIDGTGRSISRRERPHIILKNGVPLAMTNGVTPAFPCNYPDGCPVDYSYTSLQMLRQTQDE